MATSAPVLVRNTHPGPTVFTYGKSAEDFVEWSGAGDPNGGDLQPVPADLLNNVQFRRSLVRGILVVEEDEDITAIALGDHRREWEERQQGQKEAAVEAIDIAPKNDFLMLACVAPSRKGSNKACGQEISVRASERFARPPLCTEHQFMQAMFTSEATGNLISGEPEMIWRKAEIAPRGSELPPQE